MEKDDTREYNPNKYDTNKNLNFPYSGEDPESRYLKLKHISPDEKNIENLYNEEEEFIASL